MSKSTLPHPTGVCPVCNGSYQQPDGKECRNCGAQRMYGKATGWVRIAADGRPCRHRYQASHGARGLSRYHCDACGDYYEIDSGD